MHVISPVTQSVISVLFDLVWASSQNSNWSSAAYFVYDSAQQPCVLWWSG
jgi:hypothetical protein